MVSTKFLGGFSLRFPWDFQKKLCFSLILNWGAAKNLRKWPAVGEKLERVAHRR